ncbi:ribonuclease E/G [Nisaea sp.]|uniref:ribonuclease E/G n=1 Tax=Nisaea sp. TaxID=2024842 RepID=UPI0032EAEA7C
MRDPDRLILDRSPGETRIAALVDGTLTDFWIDRVGGASRRAGEIVLARVTAVRPELNAAFVDLGHGEAFLKLGKKTPPPEGSLVPVTLTTDAAGRKQPQATRQLSLPGRYLSLRPEEPDLAIAGTLKAKGKRERLKTLLQPLLPPDIGLLVSAEAAEADDIQLLSDLTALLTEWQAVGDAIAAGEGPKIIRPAPDLVSRIRAAFPAASIAESSAGALFAEEDLDTGIDRALARRLQLPGGAVLTFDETEALVAIDVDIAGAAAGPKAWAQLFEGMTGELAAAIRLRRLSGLVLVDFPKLPAKADRDRVAAAMQAAFDGWPCLMQEQPPQVLGWTRSGVLEIIVTRTGRSLRDDLMRPVEQHPRAATIALEALRRLLRETRSIAQPEMICAQDIADWLEGPGRAALGETKEKLGGSLKVTADPSYRLEQIEIGPARR